MDPVFVQRLGYRAVFCALSGLVLFLHVLPLNTGQARLPMPDFILVLACVWMMRRPDLLPAVFFGVIMLIADIVLSRPLGLWAALSVLGTEFLRRYAFTHQMVPFMAEWGTVAAILAIMTATNALILTAFLVSQPTFAGIVGQLSLTILAYPLAMVFCKFFLGIDPLSPIEAERILSGK